MPTINLYGIPSLIISWGIGFLIVAIFVRVILSWFGIDERYTIVRFLARITDPLLNPVRRIMRNVGVFDLSFLVVSFLLIILRELLLQALPLGW